jgi:tetratricopeptide (TPR) repeat protein
MPQEDEGDDEMIASEPRIDERWAPLMTTVLESGSVHELLLKLPRPEDTRESLEKLSQMARRLELSGRPQEAALVALRRIEIEDTPQARHELLRILQLWSQKLPDDVNLLERVEELSGVPGEPQSGPEAEEAPARQETVRPPAPKPPATKLPVKPPEPKVEEKPPAKAPEPPPESRPAPRPAASDEEAGLDDLRERLYEDPSNADLREQAIEALGSDPSGLVRFYREISARVPESAPHLLNVARAYVHSQQDQLAVLNFQKALKLEATAEGYRELAAIFLRLGKTEMAAKTAEKARELEG